MNCPFFLRLSAGCCLVVVLATTFASAHDIQTLRDLQTRSPATSYRCSDRVWLDIRWEALSPAPHRVRVEWLRPDGALQDHSEGTWDVPVAESWFWLEVAPSAAFWRPSSGGVAGAWRVRVYLDDQLLAARQFFLLC